MSDRPSNQDRKEKLDLRRAKQRAEARAKLPLNDNLMQALFDMLDKALPERGCDHTLRLVRAWAEKSRVEFETLAACITAGFAIAKSLPIAGSAGTTRITT